MKTLKYLAILGLVGISLALPQKKGSCAFGEEYNDGCNHCICHGESGSTCTRLPGCKTGTSKPSNPTRDYIASVSRGHCSLGADFKKDCNICTCQGDLGYVCTSKECPDYNQKDNTKSGSGSFPESPVQNLQETKGKCILGHKFFNGCDLCTCYGEYFGYRCSRMQNCREQTTSIPTRITSRPAYFEKNIDKCPHGKTYYDGYYFCSCRKDNLGYVCTNTIHS